MKKLETTKLNKTSKLDKISNQNEMKKLDKTSKQTIQITSKSNEMTKLEASKL